MPHPDQQPDHALMPPANEAVLGVAMSSAGMGLILIQGRDGDGLTLYRDTFDVPIHDDGTCCAADTPELSAVLGSSLSIPDGTRLRAVLTATRDVAAEASRLLASLADDDRLSASDISHLRSCRGQALNLSSSSHPVTPFGGNRLGHYQEVITAALTSCEATHSNWACRR